MQTKSDGIIIKCQRCGHQRMYRGKNPFFTICTYCRTSISIKKNEVKPTLPNQDWTPVEAALAVEQHQGDVEN